MAQIIDTSHAYTVKAGVVTPGLAPTSTGIIITDKTGTHWVATIDGSDNKVDVTNLVIHNAINDATGNILTIDETGLLCNSTKRFDDTLVDTSTVWSAQQVANYVASHSGGTAQLADKSFIIKTPNSELANAQVLAELETGLLKTTTSTGDLSIAVVNSDYLAPSAFSNDIPTMNGEGNSGKTLKIARADHEHPTDTSRQEALTFGNLTSGSAKISITGNPTNSIIGTGISIDINEANINHNSLAGLANGNPHTQYVLNSTIGAANGVAPLGADGKIASAYMPAISIIDTYVVASQAAMLTLTAQRGDIAIRTDSSTTYILQGDDPSVLSNWVSFATPTNTVSSIFGRTGTVTSQAGDYTQNQITGLTTTSDVTFNNLTLSGLTANSVIYLDANKKIVTSGSVSLTELGYLDGVTSNVQTQLNGKASSTATMTIGTTTIALGATTTSIAGLTTLGVGTITGFTVSSGNAGLFMQPEGAKAYGGTSTTAPVEVRLNSATSGDAMIAFHLPNRYAGFFGLDGDTNDIFWGGWSVGSVKNRVFHAGNSTYINKLANSVNLGTTLFWSSTDAAIELGIDKTADGYSLIDFHARAGSDFDTRIVRWGGVNSNFDILQSGTGSLNLLNQYGDIYFKSKAGLVNYDYSSGTTMVIQGYRLYTNGNNNLHLDPGGSGASYLNYYSGTSGVNFCNGAGTVVANIGTNGGIWSNTNIAEANVGVAYIAGGRNMYMYANSSARGIYDTYAGYVFGRSWSDSYWKFNGYTTCMPVNTKTAAYTLVANDAGKMIIMNPSTAVTLTVPSGIFNVGDVITICNLSTYAVTIAGSGTTISSAGGYMRLTLQSSVATLICRAANTFILAGNLSA